MTMCGMGDFRHANEESHLLYGLCVSTALNGGLTLCMENGTNGFVWRRREGRRWRKRGVGMYVEGAYLCRIKNN